MPIITISGAVEVRWNAMCCEAAAISTHLSVEIIEKDVERLRLGKGSAFCTRGVSLRSGAPFGTPERRDAKLHHDSVCHECDVTHAAKPTPI